MSGDARDWSPFQRDLLAVIRDLSFCRDLGRTTEIVRAAARRLTRADGITFVLREGDNCFYADEDAIAPLWKGRRFPMSTCISGWVMEHGRTVAITDIYQDDRIPHDAYRPTFVRSLLMVPVRQQEPVAAIGAYWATEHEASPEEVAVLEALADAASLALTHVAMWADLEQARGTSETQRLELARVNRELLRRVHEFETLLNVLPVGIGVALDPQATTIRTNKAFTELLRLAPDANASLSAPEGERPNHFRLLKDGHELLPEDLPLQKAAREGAEIRNLELALVFDSGDERRLLEYAAPLFDEQGAVRGSVGAFIDITDRKHLEEQREALLVVERQAREEAERTNRIKDEFLASLSHELRTPLNAVLGWAQLLRAKRASPEFLEQGLEVLERNAKLQARLIEDLLDMSAILSGKVRLDLQPLMLSQIVESAIESVRPSADAKGVQLRSSIAPDPGPVPLDATRVQQILWNLLTNAVKFTDGGGDVHVVVDYTSAHVHIAVSDTGIGISDAFLPFVFERFRQADASTTRRYSGLGIGLSIVKHLVELHGGTIEARSAGEGHGATFVVTLPATIAPRAGAVELRRTGPSAAEATPVLTGLSVLLIEDDTDAQLLVTWFLRECGARVTAVNSGRAALDELAASIPDVIVSDIGLPDQDGYEILRQIRALGPALARIPALALTAFARAEDRDRAIVEGFEMHVAKPVDRHELCAAIASLARRASS
jgi:signal transduction histidine kinase/ActR/RegA family two-component response regulator